MRAPAAAFAAFAFACAFACARASDAEPRDPAAAEAFFAEGRTLLKQGRFAEACAKFEASQRLDPANGTLMNLADCYEKSGRFASAWLAFREAAAGAAGAGQAARAAHARTRAADIEPRLCRVRIDVDASVLAPVLRDGIALDRAVYGEAVPVDPGRHAVVVRKGDAVLFLREIDVAPTANGACETITVAVPALKDASTPTSTSTSTSTSTPPQTSTSTSAPAAGAGSAAPAASVATSHKNLTLPLVVAGVGVAGIAAGTFLGFRAKSTWDEARSKCTSNGCGDEAQALASTAREQAGIGTVAGLAGAALVATGVVLFIVTPSSGPSVGVGVTPSSRSLIAHGTF